MQRRHQPLGSRRSIRKGPLYDTYSFQLWIERAAHPATVKILPITPAIAAQFTLLPSSFHRDPAYRIIVSTARVRGLALLTKDRKILAAKIVPAWKP